MLGVAYMLAEERMRRQDLLVKHIFELSQKLLENQEIRKTALEIRELYLPDFRHSYY